MKSIWQDVQLPDFPILNRNIETDVLIIGGGICGVLCAYRLTQSGKRVVLVEANKIASGRTRGTTAVGTALQDVYYSDLEKSFSKLKAKQYLQANLDSIEEYKKLAQYFSFDLETISTYKYFTNNEKKNQELRFLKKIGYDVKFNDKRNAIQFDNQVQFHPLKLIKELIKNLEIYEHTRVLHIKEGYAETLNHQIHCSHIIVATGYPFFKVKGHYFLRLHQNKSYVVSISQKEAPFSGIGEIDSDIYFRTYKDNLIIGGNEQKTGKYGKGYTPVLDYIREHYPNKEFNFNWVNQDCVTADGLPYIGGYGSFRNIFVATGFNLWGMTGAMISSMVLTDLIWQKPNAYAGLFTPKRRTPIIELIKAILTAGINFIKPRKRCGHLGCGLYYNSKEQVYECPCHGTKYSKNGKVIFNPANQDKQ